MEKTGVAAIHIEDQVLAKRCGHRPNKAIVSLKEMGDRIKAAVDAKQDPDFVIMARTDAYAKRCCPDWQDQRGAGAQLAWPNLRYRLPLFQRSLDNPLN